MKKSIKNSITENLANETKNTEYLILILIKELQIVQY